MQDRTIGQIVGQVMNAVPAEHKHLFDKIMEDLLYTAPEAMGYWFDKFQRTFNYVIPNPPAEDWHFQAIAALTRQSVEDVKSQFKTE